jgi:hypothetical protein
LIFAVKTLFWQKVIVFLHESLRFLDAFLSQTALLLNVTRVTGWFKKLFQVNV